jgi:hypothetical protein
MFSIWLLVFILNGLTIYITLVSHIPQTFWELLIVVEGAVIADLFLHELAEKLEEPTILMEPWSKNSDVGFSVRVKDKNVKDASVYCDFQK